MLHQYSVLPHCRLGREFNGIIHIHGSIQQPDEMVLTDRDFGRAYLTEGWARRFLLDLYDKFTILFVGYSHSDTVMNYLVRALPPVRAGFPRYALVACKDADHDRWSRLETTVIPYPQHDENDHSELDKAISKLADVVRRGMVGWQREISALAENPPHELNEEEEEILAHALEDETKTKFFTKSASHPEWIEWLDKRGHFTRLFGSGQLRESDKVLSWWMAGFVFKHAHLLFRLISKHNTRIHPTFWQDIAQVIKRHDESSLDTKILSRWISLLLSTAPDEGTTPDGGYVFTSECLASIAQRCIAHQMINELLSIFDAMIQGRVSIRDSYCLFGDESEENLRFNVKLKLLGKSNELDELWTEGLKPNLSKIALPLLERVVWRLRDYFLTYGTWTQTDRPLDSVSMRRSAIELHEQDEQRGRYEFDVLIDAARDCLDWLATHEPNVAAQWCNRLAKSDSSLQRRLAVNSLSKRQDLTPDEKIQWLLEYIDLHEYTIHHEVYLAIRDAYLGVGSHCRVTFIEKVKSYRFLHEEHPDNPDNEEITAREHFDWFHWIHKSDPTCPLAKQALDKVLKEYPHFKPKDHPDFTSWIESGWVGLPTLWTAEELLRKPPSYWVDKLLSVKDAEEDGANPRRAYSDSLRSDKTKLRLEPWLGGSTSRGWEMGCLSLARLDKHVGKMELEEEQHRQILSRLGNNQLYSKHSREIADALYALVKNGGPSHAVELLPQAKQIAFALWRRLDRAISVDVKHGWFNQSGEYPFGDSPISGSPRLRSGDNNRILHRQLLVKIIAAPC